ncbi:MAG TPA: rhamnulokinase family protein [Dermatophilaceae bacterium]
MATTLAAVDIGASSGRVIVGSFAGGRVAMTEAGRFANGPVSVQEGGRLRLHWDVRRLWEGVLNGLRTAARDAGSLDGIGIDTWGVDYGLFDLDGNLTRDPASYRCTRTQGAIERVFEHFSGEAMYKVNGAQVQPFNTMFQLVSEEPDDLKTASRLLLMPDLLGYWLSGRMLAEMTNASTTGLVDVQRREWAEGVCADLECAFGIPVRRLLPDIVEPGTVIGPVRQQVIELTTPAGAPTPLIAVGSHDTASAVVSIPAKGSNFAYISCGTWSLVGLELPKPVLSEASRAANFTNELGVDHTVRFLKNVMGLWILNECVRVWKDEGVETSVAHLVGEAADVPLMRTVVDVDDPVFLHPGDMASRITDLARESGQPLPLTSAEYARCILDSLALAYRRAVREGAQLADHPVEVVHIVGGGVRAKLLCQLTADATGLPVIAGPKEGSALGSLLVQARTVGAIHGGLPAMRQVVRASCPTARYEPDTAHRTAWDAAERRLLR